MSPSRRDDPERLVAAWGSRAGALEVYQQLREPMRQAARKGLRISLGGTPDEGDVDDVVARAFSEVLTADPNETKRDPVAFAKVVAYRRAIDRARVIRRERGTLDGLLPELDRVRPTDADLEEAAAREGLRQAAIDALSDLTADQREVIERTVRGQESLSNWALERGVTYEAARRMRARGLEAVCKPIGGTVQGTLKDRVKGD